MHYASSACQVVLYIHKSLVRRRALLFKLNPTLAFQRNATFERACNGRISLVLGKDYKMSPLCSLPLSHFQRFAQLRQYLSLSLPSPHLSKIRPYTHEHSDDCPRQKQQPAYTPT